MLSDLATKPWEQDISSLIIRDTGVVIKIVLFLKYDTQNANSAWAKAPILTTEGLIMIRITVTQD